MKSTLIKTLAAASVIGLGFGAVAMADQKGDRATKKAEKIQQFDTNGDGKLDEAEREAIRLSKFAEFDTDGSGSLSRAEITTRQQAKLSEELDRYFSNEDANGDGVISVDEFGATRKAKRGERKAKRGERRAEALEKFDADGDGTLNDAERAAAREAGFERRGQRGPREGRGSAN